MSSEIRVVAIVQAKPGQAPAVARAIAACVASSRAEAGCREYTAHRDREHPDRFVFVERWADGDAMAAHERSAHFQALAQALAPRVQGELQVLKLEELAAAP